MTSDNGQNLAAIADELYRLGLDLLRVGTVRQAAFQFRKALTMSPDFTAAAIALGHCLHIQGEFAQALAIYVEALAGSPDSAVLWNNQGNTLMELGLHDRAVESYSRALAISPELHDARIARATCLQALGQFDAAMADCDHVLAADPEHAEAHWNRSLLLLLQGDFAAGWREYEWRWRKRNFTSPLRDFQQSRWTGEPAAGQTILIHAEQGFGDTLQFCRYLPLVAARCARVVFECQPPLVRLMADLSANVTVIPMGTALPAFDLHAPLLSLPLLFGSVLATIPAAPRLSLPDTIPAWLSLMTIGERRLRVGICWAGKSYPDPRRSCAVEQLAPLAGVARVELYSLQMNPVGEIPFAMTDLTSQISDFADTATLISRLDLVITIDTAIAHLAGTLGIKTWVMLPQVPDWRWLLGRDDSPWYPGMRLFRQTRAAEWSDVVARIAELLRCEAGSLGNNLLPK